MRILFYLLLLATALPALRAADLDDYTTETDTSTTTSEAADYLTRRAALYLIRSAFDVIEREHIPLLLQLDLAALRKSSVPEVDLAETNAALAAEGSYYIVSLKYLAEVDGAVWPEDRDTESYRRDALAILEALQRKWVDAALLGADLAAMLVEIDRVNAWSNGFAVVPEDLDHFSALPALVATALGSAIGTPR